MSSTPVATSAFADRVSQFTTILPLSHLAGVCWQATSAARRAAHGRHGRGSCPTRRAPYGHDDLHGAAISEVCLADDCLDLYHDVLVGVGARLQRRWATAPPPTDPIRYAASVVPTLLVDRQRAARVAKGWPAKPSRSDGVAAIVNAQLLATAADGTSGQWYVVLFRIIRTYAATDERFTAAWPIAGLTQEKSRYLAASEPSGALPAASAVATTSVAGDIRHVLAVAEHTAGREWVNRNLWQPLLSGASPVQIPDDVLAPGGDLEDQVLSAWFRDEYVSRRRRGLSVSESFRRAASVISGRRLADPDVGVVALLTDLETADRR